MDLWDIAKTVLRRWYVVLPTLVVAGIIATLMTNGRTPTYEVTSSVILVPPGQDPAPTSLTGQQNPYLAFTGSQETTANAVVAVLQGPRVRSEIRAMGVANPYEVAVDRDAPIITITTVADEPGLATRAMQRLIDVVNESLVDLQDSVEAPAESRISASLLVAPTQARMERGNLKRLVVTIAGLGVAAAVSLALIVDALVAPSGRGGHRRGRRRRRGAEDTDFRDDTVLAGEQVGVLATTSSGRAGAASGDGETSAEVMGPLPAAPESSLRVRFRSWAGDADADLFVAPLANSPSSGRSRTAVEPVNGRPPDPELEQDLREMVHLLESAGSSSDGSKGRRGKRGKRAEAKPDLERDLREMLHLLESAGSSGASGRGNGTQGKGAAPLG